jgi:23S rRNA (guanosine2251-2'-O)-methyltransferase
MKNNIFCGFHSIENALTENQVKEVFVDSRRKDKRIKNLLKVSTASNLPISFVSKTDLDQIAGGMRHQGIIARGIDAITRKGLLGYLKTIDCPLVLILDGLNDPANIGSCIRSAAVAGADCAVIPKNHGCGLTATVVRVAAGGATMIPIFEESNWGPLLDGIRKLGLWLIGLDENSELDLYVVDLAVPIALVIGSEDRGLRQLTRKKCDQLVKIPAGGSIKSLNAGTASGVALFEACRQRRG